MSSRFGLSVDESEYSVIDPIAISGILTHMERDSRVYSDAGMSLAGTGDTVTRWYYRNDISKWANQADADDKPTYRVTYIECDVAKYMTINSRALSTGDWSAYFTLNTLPYSTTASNFWLMYNSTLGTMFGIRTVISVGVYNTYAILTDDAGNSDTILIANTQVTGIPTLKISRSGTTITAKITGQSAVTTTIAGTNAYTVDRVMAAQQVAYSIKQFILYNKVLSGSEENGLTGYLLSKDGSII